MKNFVIYTILALSALTLFPFASARAQDNPGAAPIDIGSRRELFWDDCLINPDKTTATLTLHHLQPREIVINSDEPWEGDGGGYYNLLNDDGLYRMYYLAGKQLNPEGTKESSQPFVVCYAESRDGKIWVKPHLGICAFNGMRENNIILDGATAKFDNFSVFKDANPACPPVLLAPPLSTLVTWAGSVPKVQKLRTWGKTLGPKPLGPEPHTPNSRNPFLSQGWTGCN